MKRNMETREVRNTEAGAQRNTQTFEPCGPVMKIITLELNARTKGKANKRGAKVVMFEDMIIAAVGHKYPKLVEAFNIIRREAKA